MTRLLYLALVCIPAFGQITIKAYDNKPVTMAATDLANLPRHTAVLNDHGKPVNYEGVLMHDLLDKAGVEFGTGLKGKQLSSYVAAVGSDGYQVVFSLAEFDPTVVDSNIILAEKRDGQPLSGTEGTLRIVAPNDKRPTRSVRMLQEINVVQLRK